MVKRIPTSRSFIDFLYDGFSILILHWALFKPIIKYRKLAKKNFMELNI